VTNAGLWNWLLVLLLLLLSLSPDLREIFLEANSTMEAEWVGKWGCQGVGDGVGNANGDGGWWMGFCSGTCSMLDCATIAMGPYIYVSQLIIPCIYVLLSVCVLTPWGRIGA